ncbi:MULTISPECIES: TonB-dependent receptor [Olivibacter]|uniref:TonB-dependent receptor domain-containing protein n=1 Tax=Olivibacter oleidegradans TaxID=760123 RepID=A0ABV6HQE8_9SPHI|nr:MULTISPECIES: TonB-dependent receptor [Olivibacter]QEL03885.1 TonB-dependent receptor [Olivibacter sp. LS-1]
MNKAIGLILWLCTGNLCVAQHTLTTILKDAETKEPLTGATVLQIGTTKGGTTDEKGTVSLTGLSEGRHVFLFRKLGYEEQRDTLYFPGSEDTVIVYLEATDEDLEEVVISSTRSTRTIQNIPTRVEFIGGEELEEKGNMKPGDIRMMLNESTGIQTQQVSATSANSSIRIQGLDGRYTQILKDGFPLYAGFSGGLGLLQTPPLDLKQVEIIKGSSSTLYGGGAIAGLVNLVSNIPTEERELRFLLNGTSAGGLDINGFYGQKFEKVGLTVFASRNSSRPYNPSSTGFTAIPKTERYVLNPKLFVYFNPKTTMNFGINTIFEDRTGGDILYIKGKGDNVHSYFEKNKSSRFSTQFALDHRFTENSGLTIKNSVNNFNRTITIPDYVFDGKQWSIYSEVAYNNNGERADWVAGINLYTDNFSEYPKDGFQKRDYDQNTFGGFVQNTFKTTDWLQLETGIRGDYVIDYGFVFLPRISALFTVSPQVTSRLGGGLGYKTPTIFTEETERIQFRSVLPISPQANKLERSYGASYDINYRTTLFENISLSVNQLFFYTRINDPLLTEFTGSGTVQLVNVDGYVDTKGWETNVKLGYGDFKLFIGYTFTDAWLREGTQKRENPLTARHRLNNVLMYEIEDKWKLGLEAYYYSRQALSDCTTGKPYWTCGFMAEKIWERFSLFVNFENFTDTRQTRFDSIYTGTVTRPIFRDIYAPLDGFVVNGGLKIKL